MTAAEAAKQTEQYDIHLKKCFVLISQAAKVGKNVVEAFDIPFQTRERLRSLGYKCKEDPHGITWIKW